MTERKGGLVTSSRILRDEGVACIVVETAGKRIRFFTDQDLAQKISVQDSRVTSFHSIAADTNADTVTFGKVLQDGQSHFWTYQRGKSSFTTVFCELPNVSSEEKGSRDLPGLAVYLKDRKN